MGVPFLVIKGPLTIAESAQLGILQESQALLGPVFTSVLRIAEVIYYLYIFQQKELK